MPMLTHMPIGASTSCYCMRITPMKKSAKRDPLGHPMRMCLFHAIRMPEYRSIFYRRSSSWSKLPTPKERTKITPRRRRELPTPKERRKSLPEGDENFPHEVKHDFPKPKPKASKDKDKSQEEEPLPDPSHVRGSEATRRVRET